MANNSNPVHRITRWTAVAADETPWCGRADDEAMVNRTAHDAAVTCRQCLLRQNGKPSSDLIGAIQSDGVLNTLASIAGSPVRR